MYLNVDGYKSIATLGYNTKILNFKQKLLSLLIEGESPFSIPKTFTFEFYIRDLIVAFEKLHSRAVFCISSSAHLLIKCYAFKFFDLINIKIHSFHLSILRFCVSFNCFRLMQTLFVGVTVTE